MNPWYVNQIKTTPKNIRWKRWFYRYFPGALKCQCCLKSLRTSSCIMKYLIPTAFYEIYEILRKQDLTLWTSPGAVDRFKTKQGKKRMWFVSPVNLYLGTRWRLVRAINLLFLLDFIHHIAFPRALCGGVFPVGHDR